MNSALCRADKGVKTSKDEKFKEGAGMHSFS